jgi:polyhydroxyalkanoate synthesis regulator phasin
LIGPRDAIEQTIVVSIGAASLTRERAQAVVDELVRRGTLGAEEGKAMVDRVMARVRGEAGPTAGVLGRVEEGVRGVMRDVGVVTRPEVEDLDMRLAALEHRIKLLESAAGTAPSPAGEGAQGTG